MKRLFPHHTMPTDAKNYIEPEQPKGSSNTAQGQIQPRKRMAMKKGQKQVSISNSN